MAADIEALLSELHRRHHRTLVAPLIRVLKSFEAAEDVVQDAFSKALAAWRDDGPPDEPLAWLHRAAKNRALDVVRRQARWARKSSELAAAVPEAVEMPDLDAAPLRDDTLRLIFTCCHPSLSPDAQVALTLRTVCGLTSEQVARAFLLQTPTLQQRLVRARRKIDRAGIPYEVPDRDQLPERLAGVLRTIYLVFNEGYDATDGEALIRRELCEEAIRLGRLVVELLPEAADAQALLALMMLHHARWATRTDAQGDLVTLEEQDRARWDRVLVEEALPWVEAALRARPVSTYALEAAIAALHMRAETAEATDWPQIAALYRELEMRSGGSPVVALNAAVATAMAGALEAGLARLEGLARDPALASYHLLPAARADLLRRAGRLGEARAAYAEALSRARNPVERRFLEMRMSGLGPGEPTGAQEN